MTSRNLEILDRDECMALLRTQVVGRVGVQFATEPTVLPVVFAMLGDDVVFRTDPGTKLSAAVMGAMVAFEVDEADAATRSGWSVVVVGPAEEVREAATLAKVEALGLAPWAPEGRDHVIRISARRVTGRRLAPR